MRQADPFQRVVGRKPRLTEHGGGKGEVLARAQSRLQPVAMGDPVQPLRQGRLAGTAERDPPRCRAQPAGENGEQRRFARPVAPGHEQCVPLPEIEAEPAKDQPPRPPAGEIAYRQVQGRAGPAPAIRCGSVCRITTHLVSRAPKIALPMRTWVAPSWIAAA